jgi:hypothetical protein
LKIENRKKVSTECFIKARDVIFNLNPELFREVENKRFDLRKAFMWHGVCEMSVAQSQKMIEEHLTDKILNYVSILEKKLENTTGENVTDMKELMVNFIHNFAIEMAPEIFSTWHKNNEEIKHIPENKQLNSVIECVIS